MIKPAIVAVGYNRPDGMKRLLDSIGKATYNCDDVPLIISIDESNRSNEVESMATAFEWTHGIKEIRRFPERQGLRKHIVQCGDLSEKYGAVIILEDDLVVAEDFYTYVCAAHEKYGDEEEICGVALYSYGCNVFTHYNFIPVPSLSDVYLGGMVVTWGQSWNARQWKNFKAWYFEHEDKLPVLNPNIPRDISSWTRSWGRYFASFIAEKHLYYVYPYQSRTTCFSDFGEHNKVTVPVTFVQVPLMRGCPQRYSMVDMSNLVKYDSFYERVLSKDDRVCGISGDEICLDLSNMKTTAGGMRYVVTNSKLPYKEVASFALTLRPASLNVTEGIPGEQLHMYDMGGHNDLIRKWDGNRPHYEANHLRIRYEYHDVSWRVMKFYSLKEFFIRLRDIVKDKLKQEKYMSSLKSRLQEIGFFKNAGHWAFKNFCVAASRINPEYASKVRYRYYLGKPLNLKTPQTLNEKMMYLKLRVYWDKQFVADSADKYRVHEVVKEKGCPEILNELYGAWERVEDIEWDKLPQRFAIKCNHGSGYNIICKDKTTFNISEAEEKLRGWLKEKYGVERAEQGIYSKIKPMIIAEKFIETADNKPPKDYKFFCSYGDVKFMFVASDRIDGQTKFDYYWPDWTWIPVKNQHPNVGPVEKPAMLEKMMEYARKLSKDLPLIRVDLYNEGEQIIFGELTFTHFGCLNAFDPDEYDLTFGQCFPDVTLVKEDRK